LRLTIVWETPTLREIEIYKIERIASKYSPALVKGIPSHFDVVFCRHGFINIIKKISMHSGSRKRLGLNQRELSSSPSTNAANGIQ
jgi:hypothetical protein